MVENRLTVKLSDGSDIMEGLAGLAKREGIDYGFLVGANGKIRDYELLSSAQSGLEKSRSAEESQLKAVSGKIYKKGDGKYDIQVKASIAKSGLGAVHGSLLKGKASGTLELSVRKIALNKIIEA